MPMMKTWMKTMNPSLRNTAMLAAFALASSVPALAADEIPFSEARVFFELNDTDGDLGLHASIDGQPWKTLAIFDPRERAILRVSPIARLRLQGLTQLMLESGEPPFDELDPAVFFQRFPEGVYEVEGISLEGEEMESEVRLSHLLPNRAQNLRINGVPAAESCDRDDVPVVSPPVVITWDPVTQAHPTLGRRGAVTVNRYQVFAEQRKPNALKYSLDLAPTVTQYVVAPELIAVGDAEYKFEIQVRAANGNQTAVENCFKVQ